MILCLLTFIILHVQMIPLHPNRKIVKSGKQNPLDLSCESLRRQWKKRQSFFTNDILRNLIGEEILLLVCEKAFWMRTEKKRKLNHIFLAKLIHFVYHRTHSNGAKCEPPPVQAPKKKRRQEIYAKHQQTLRYIIGDWTNEGREKNEVWKSIRIQTWKFSLWFHFFFGCFASRKIDDEQRLFSLHHTHFFSPPRRREFSWDDGRKKTRRKKIFFLFFPPHSFGFSFDAIKDHKLDCYWGFFIILFISFYMLRLNKINPASDLCMLKWRSGWEFAREANDISGS